MKKPLPLWKEIAIDYIFPFAIGGIMGHILNSMLIDSLPLYQIFLLAVISGFCVGCFIWVPIGRWLKGE